MSGLPIRSIYAWNWSSGAAASIAKVTSATLQMSQVRDVIGERRASGAGMLVVGLEHVVIDDQLASPLEHVEKARRPVGSGCLERRIDLGHRQASTLRRNCVTSARMCLLGDQQLVTGLSPVLR